MRMGCITVLRLPQLLAREALIRKRRDRVTWIAPSDFMRRELLQAGYGKVVREPYGFDIESYPYYPPESRKGASAVLFLSRLDYSKGTHVLVRAFQTAAADVPGLKLFIGGEGSQMGPLRRLVYNLKLEDKVSLLGWIGQDRIKELHLRAGLVCAPFLGPDNQPLLVCEAMIMGTPLAATKVGGVPELVEHGVSGLLTEPGDANMLARAMLTLLEDVRLADRFAKKGRKKAEEMLHMEKHISMLTKIYTKRF